MIALQAELNEMRNLSDHISQAYERCALHMTACTSKAFHMI